MKNKLIVFSLVAASVFVASCHNSKGNKNIIMNTKDSTASSNLKEDSVNFSVNGKNYVGYVAYDENLKGKRPGILVVPEWWGLNAYTKSRAKQLAELGYIAMAIDVW